MFRLPSIWGRWRDSRVEERTGEMSGARLAERLGAGELMQLVDIRSPELFAARHLRGAVNVPFGDLLTAVDKLDPALPTVVY
jgi:rhodanese-related sulfurtransferase